jgi:glycosyltransferase involved in cell wall biosynthesis
MRIAVIGPYGLPALYGGIERHSEEIYSRLVEQGHEVTLYSRANYSKFSGMHRGIRVVKVPVLPFSGWESAFYAPMATVHALATGKYDVFHYHSLPSSSYAWLPKIFRKRVACTVHSVDWRHPRWGRVARALLHGSEYAAVTFPDVTIAVSEAVRTDLLSRHPGRSILVIPNGVDPAPDPEPLHTLEEPGLKAGEYLLYVGRLVSEKGAHLLVEAANRLPNVPVVLVGGSRYSDKYIEDMKSAAGSNVKFLGFRYGKELSALFSHARAVVVPSLEEGFSLISIEAMSYGRPVIASDIPALRERLGDRGYYFRRGDTESLVAAIEDLTSHPDEMERRGAEGQVIALRDYGWDRISSLTLAALLPHKEAGAAPAKRLHVAFIGTRGVPASYSGFETCVEQVGKRMVERGYEVTVFCRNTHFRSRPPSHLGMKLVYLPAVPQKHLETMSHSMLSALVLPRGAAIVCMGVGNAPLVRVLETAGRGVVFNVDGSDWQRRKWGLLARWYLRWCEQIVSRGRSIVIADAEAVQSYYATVYQRQTELVPYGADPPADVGTETLDRFGLKPESYLLFVGRLVPENSPDAFLAGVSLAAIGVPAVVVGDATYSSGYKARLKAAAPASTVFTGYQFGSDYQQLTSHAGIFVLAATVGGTHPVLVEQMVAGNAILARETESNREVLGDAGLYWETPDQLAELLRRVWPDRQMRRDLGQAAHRRAVERYSWERVTSQYLELCERSLGGGSESIPGSQQEEVRSAAR